MSVAWSTGTERGRRPIQRHAAWRKLIGSESPITARGLELAARLHMPQTPVSAGNQEVARGRRRGYRAAISADDAESCRGRSGQIGSGNGGRY